MLILAHAKQMFFHDVLASSPPRASVACRIVFPIKIFFFRLSLQFPIRLTLRPVPSLPPSIINIYAPASMMNFEEYKKFMQMLKRVVLEAGKGRCGN